jgi:hypothetical protein
MQLHYKLSSLQQIQLSSSIQYPVLQCGVKVYFAPAGASELTVPTFAWRSGALATTAYYLLSHVAETLSQKEAKTLLTIIFIGHGLLADILARPLDFTQPIAQILHGVLNIPIPAHDASPAPAISDHSGGKDNKKKN